jgi:hypothetical protein
LGDVVWSLNEAWGPIFSPMLSIRGLGMELPDLK